MQLVTFRSLGRGNLGGSLAGLGRIGDSLGEGSCLRLILDLLDFINYEYVSLSLLLVKRITHNEEVINLVRETSV